MLRTAALTLLSVTGLGTATVSTATVLPSGLDAELREVLIEQIGAESWVRFRFLAPEIDRTRPEAPEFMELEPDFLHLCASVALPYLEAHALDADKVVISIADRIVEFGVTDPDATQYFELYRVNGGSCDWEAF